MTETPERCPKCSMPMPCERHPIQADSRATVEGEPYAYRSVSGDVWARPGCPCRYVEPCDPSCTCATPVSSFGCLRCCSYGSREQRKARALELITHPRLDDAMVERIAEIVEQSDFSVASNMSHRKRIIRDAIREAAKETK